MCGSTHTTSIIRMSDLIMLSKYGKLLTGKMYKKDSITQQQRNRRNKNEIFISLLNQTIFLLLKLSIA